jgi:hypothetical protein
MALARHGGTDTSSVRLTHARAVEQRHSAIQNAQATRTVAGHAADVQDCLDLLAMLGLDARDGKRN